MGRYTTMHPLLVEAGQRRVHTDPTVSIASKSGAKAAVAVKQLRSRNDTGFDDVLGRSLMVAGTIATTLPDPVVIGAVSLVTRNPGLGVKTAMYLNVAGLVAVGAGYLLTVRD